MSGNWERENGSQRYSQGRSVTVSPAMPRPRRRGPEWANVEYAMARGYTRPEPRGLMTADGGRRLRALLSVATRDGITAFARELQSLGVEIYATDGTRDHLA